MQVENFGIEFVCAMKEMFGLSLSVDTIILFHFPGTALGSQKKIFSTEDL